MYLTETVVMDPRLIAKLPMAMACGPFKDDLLTMQWGWGHGWYQCVAKVNFQVGGEMEGAPLPQAPANLGNSAQWGGWD